jgi:hypothetical protein
VAHDNIHSRRIDEWMKHAASMARDQRAVAFEKALTALWRRTYSALGDITVSAILNRVLYEASGKYSILGSLKLDSDGINFTEFRVQAASCGDRELSEAIQFVLVELLTVVGNLTAEILTPALHSELSRTLKDLPGKPSGKEKL